MQYTCFESVGKEKYLSESSAVPTQLCSAVQTCWHTCHLLSRVLTSTDFLDSEKHRERERALSKA